MSGTEGTRRVVVGVDGGAGGRAAVDWAVSYAEVSGAVLDLTHVYDPDTEELYGGLYPVRDASRRLDAGESQALGAAERLVGDRVRHQSHLLRGGAGRALVEHSRGAELLVIGGGAHHAVVRVLLGSTAEHCVRHSTCPVLVVPASTEVPRARRSSRGSLQVTTGRRP